MHISKSWLMAGVALAIVSPLNAEVIYSDDFSSYNTGDLDSNESGGPNQSANGGPGNPWWGPYPGNLAVASTFNGITPYQGAAHLVDGQSPSSYSEQLNNIGYRLNGGNNFAGNVSLSWAFYDPAGAGSLSRGYNDIVSLNGYQSADGYTPTADYTGNGPDLRSTFTLGDTILSLGAFNANGGNVGFYQARVLGATTANHGATFTGISGWFNLNVPRTVGWHTATIALGAPDGADTIVSMYIDGTDVLDETTGDTVGVNTISLSSGLGSEVGAFDDIIVAVPEPGVVTLMFFGGIVCLSQRRRSRE